MNDSNKEDLQASRRDFLMQLMKSGTAFGAAIVAGTSFPRSANACGWTEKDKGVITGDSYTDDICTYGCGCTCVCKVTCLCLCCCEGESPMATNRDNNRDTGHSKAPLPKSNANTVGLDNGKKKGGVFSYGYASYTWDLGSWSYGP